MLDGADRTGLGAVLKDWRARLRPRRRGASRGHPPSHAGLRSEEVAQLAGRLVDYLTRLEQGRVRAHQRRCWRHSPALRPSGAERGHLFLLAGGTPPQPGQISGTVPPSVLR